MVFLLILLMFSWGLVVNGLFIFNGLWEKLCIDLVVKFMVMLLVFYVVVIFEGLMMVIKIVNKFLYYIDWIIVYVYLGLFGWVVMIIIGLFYVMVLCVFGWLVMYLCKGMEWYFWLYMVGMFLYVGLMWIVGVIEGVMWCVM